MGCVLKQHVCGVAGVAAARVRHVTIMPCFDKKLEASREDFTHPDTGVKEVDCVLTTLEVGCSGLSDFLGKHHLPVLFVGTLTPDLSYKILRTNGTYRKGKSRHNYSFILIHMYF